MTIHLSNRTLAYVSLISLLILLLLPFINHDYPSSPQRRADLQQMDHRRVLNVESSPGLRVVFKGLGVKALSKTRT